jgi:hypothetical protein
MVQTLPGNIFHPRFLRGLNPKWLEAKSTKQVYGWSKIGVQPKPEVSGITEDYVIEIN